MSQRPECFLMKTIANLDKEENTTVFIGAIEPIPFLETIEYKINDKFVRKEFLDSEICEDLKNLDIKIELLNENLVEDLSILFPHDIAKLKVKQFDMDYYLEKFKLNHQGSEDLKKEDVTCFYALNILYIGKKEKILGLGNLGTLSFEKHFVDEINSSKLEYGVDYCYAGEDIKTIENEMNVFIFSPVKKEGRTLYEFTHDYFSWDKISNMLPKGSEVNKENLIHIILTQEDFRIYADEKAYEKRSIQDWYFKEGRHILFFNAP